MRQRKAKDLEKRLRECSAYMIDDPGSGSRDYFGHGRESRDLYVEIGCGKGQFIIKKALDDPGSDFIAIEGQETVILRALEKAAARDRSAASEGAGAAGLRHGASENPPESPHESLHLCEAAPGRLSNLKFMLTFVHSMEELFDAGQVSGIYLNFSDPWPKARHAKRRLTHRDRLRDYAKVLRPGGFIEIKTDNDDLFDFTLQEIAAAGYEAAEQTRDLHGSGYDSRLTTTEYEDKFSGMGKNINYVKVIV